MTATDDKPDANPTDRSMGGGSGAGWHELNGGEDEASAQPRRSHSGKDSSLQGGAIELEETERRRRDELSKSADPERAAGEGHDENVEAAAVGVGEYKVYKRRWFGLLQLTLLNIIVSWDWLTFSPVASHAANYFKTSETVINWLNTAFLFSFVFITPAVIYVLHFGPRPAIMTSAALILAGNWIRFAGAHSGDGGIFGVVMFGQILTGLAQPFVLSAPTRYSDLWFTNRGRVTATAVVSLANPFGAALGQLIIPFWVDKPSDVSHMVLYVAIISSVCAIPSFFIPAKPPTPAAPSCETPKLSLKASAKVLSSQLEFWLVLIPFGVYVGFFNSISSLLNQIMQPYGFSDEESGIAGALLIFVGLATSAVTSPILDRTKLFLHAIKIAVPIIALSYLVLIWMPGSGSIAGPYVISAILGASSFALVPVAVEFLAEVTHPVSPEVTSTLGWSSGQLLGGCFIIISDALKAGPDGDPPANMKRALIFTAVLALAVMPLPLLLGWFGRSEKVVLKRVRSDEMGGDASRTSNAS